ncbi:MAG: GNAT family N-acetyltransferase [Hyphomicrobiaceae bacterium]
MTAPRGRRTTIAVLPVQAGQEVSLEEVSGPLDTTIASSLAMELADIDPWHRYGFDAGRLERFLSQPFADAQRLLLVAAEERIAGIAVVRLNWLAGSYLNFLAILPAHQGSGIGGAFLDWMAGAGRERGERNQFVAATAFNTRALRLYDRHGFEQVAMLPGLIGDAETEILLRRRLR